MTSLSAKTPAEAPARKTVLFVVYPNIVLLDLVGPLQVFTHARHGGDGAHGYAPHVVSASGAQVTTNTLLAIESADMMTWLHRDVHTLIVVGGDGAIPASEDPIFVERVRQLAARAQRVCSVCSGALVLAAAGLLDGRRAVTHWEDCAMLAERFPKVSVEVDPIFVQDGAVWTSAGITAGIDMALAIVAEDLGRPTALALARSLVTPMVRSGGQSQFSAALDRQTREGIGEFAGLHAWLADNLQEAVTVAQMAEFCRMSSRNFARKYAAETGVPPAKALEAMRVGAAQDLLATTDDPIKSVAAACGFHDDERMRRAFLRRIKTTPSAYRAQFRAAATDADQR